MSIARFSSFASLRPSAVPMKPEALVTSIRTGNKPEAGTGRPERHFSIGYRCLAQGDLLAKLFDEPLLRHAAQRGRYDQRNRSLGVFTVGIQISLTARA
jgi:hypothetical protein